jgi:hypothetical protein
VRQAHVADTFLNVSRNPFDVSAFLSSQAPYWFYITANEGIFFQKPVRLVPKIAEIYMYSKYILFNRENKMTIFATLENFASKMFGFEVSLDWVNEKAEFLGIETHGRNNLDIVHDIQMAEGNEACFGSCNGQCDHCDCCFFDACIRYAY